MTKWYLTVAVFSLQIEVVLEQHCHDIKPALRDGAGQRRTLILACSPDSYVRSQPLPPRLSIKAGRST